jgi:L-glyceraldehyde 3-phosphate reductase
VDGNELTDQLRSTGMGAIAFTALAQGLLTDRYAIADAADINRATHRPTLSSSTITGDVLAKLRGLKAIADGRGQSLAQMALAWVLRDPLVVSTLIGASSVTQLNENVGALANLDFSSAELAAIDEYATDANINIWQASSEL